MEAQNKSPQTAPQSEADKMTEEAIEEYHRNHTFFLYGPPGSWKTSTAMTIKGQKLLIDVDRKASENSEVAEAIDAGECELIEITDALVLDDMDMAIGSADYYPRKKPEGFMNIINTLNDAMEANPDVIILDSMTRVVEHLRRLVKHQGKHEYISIPGWGRYLEDLEIVFNNLTVWKGIFVCIAHELVEKDDLLGQIWWKPLIDGQMKDKVGQYFHEVYHMELSEGTRGEKICQMRTFAPKGKYTCRSSIRDIDTLIDANLEKVMLHKERKKKHGTNKKST